MMLCLLDALVQDWKLARVQSLLNYGWCSVHIIDLPAAISQHDAVSAEGRRACLVISPPGLDRFQTDCLRWARLRPLPSSVMLLGKTDQAVNMYPFPVVGLHITAVPPKQLVHLADDEEQIGTGDALDKGREG